MKGRILRVVAVGAILALAASACSREKSAGTAGGGEKKTVKLGVIAPLTGPLSALGLGIKNGVDLAVKQANSKGTLKDYTIVLDAQDDTATAAVGANAANKLASDPLVAGIIGTLNSSVAQQVAPVLAKSSIAQISPANTNPTLTRGQDPLKNPKRVWPTYFRVCTTDSIQGPFAADYAYKQAGFKKVITVHDKKTYGQGLVAAFAEQFKKDGGQIASAKTINAGDRDFGQIAGEIAAAKPDFVYYGGEFPEAGPLSSQLHDRGFKGPLFGGDGIFDAGYIKGAGAKSTGDLATSVGAPTTKLDTAKQFVSDYQAGGYKENFSAYGAFAYDAANILIQAMSKGLEGASDVRSARPKIVEALGQTSNYQGAIGTTTFDEFGDTSNKVLTVYKVEGGDWKDVFSGSFGE
ncbi:MAG TPA: branched-chain amino acid ABC transporter substrate-binding protein [Actinomycetes bacterium]|nr:branched-chain amino acid ABC transporter substrate-binding protein [Actinomycetes bacterium]